MYSPVTGTTPSGPCAKSLLPSKLKVVEPPFPQLSSKVGAGTNTSAEQKSSSLLLKIFPEAAIVGTILSSIVTIAGGDLLRRQCASVFAKQCGRRR